MVNVKISELGLGAANISDTALEVEQYIASVPTSGKIPAGLIATSAKTIVASRTLTVPPSSPAEFDRYIVGASATGAWAGMDGKIAEWLQDGAGNGAWYFVTANGLVYIVAETAVFMATAGVLVSIGTIRPLLRTINANAALAATDRFIKADASSGAIVLTCNPNLGTAALTQPIHVMKIDNTTNPVSISDGTNVRAVLITPYAPPAMAAFVDIVPDGTNLICSGSP